jgi:hypothetical protein
MGLQGREANAQAKIDAAIGAADLKRKDPAIDFVHATIAADPSIATDTVKDKEGKTRMETLLENSRRLNTKPLGEVGKYDNNNDVSPSTGKNPSAAYHQPVLPGSAPPPARAALTTPTNDEPGLPQAAIGAANYFSPEEWKKRRQRLYSGE